MKLTMADLLKSKSQVTKLNGDKEQSNEANRSIVTDAGVSAESNNEDNAAAIVADASESTRMEEPATAPPPAPAGMRLRIAGSALASAGNKPAQSNPSREIDSGPAESLANDADNSGGTNQHTGKSGLLAIAGLGAADSESKSLALISNLDDRPADHVLPTEPERILPPEMDEQQAAFVKSLDSMYMVFDDAELFINVVSRIMMDLKAAPHLIEMFASDDSNVLMRGVRASAGMAQVKKIEQRAKIANRSSSSKKKIDPSLLSSVQALAGFGGFDD